MYTYDELKQFVDHCTRCPLSQTRNKAVMGKGNLHSPILFIAEGPGRNEDQDGIPFTGKSGVLLDRLLSGIHMSRDEIYITNIVKCHPPGNRDPKLQEQERCIPYLKYETLLLRPKNHCLSGKNCSSADHPAGLSYYEGAWNLCISEKCVVDGSLSSVGCLKG